MWNLWHKLVDLQSIFQSSRASSRQSIKSWVWTFQFRPHNNRLNVHFYPPVWMSQWWKWMQMFTQLIIIWCEDQSASSHFLFVFHTFFHHDCKTTLVFLSGAKNWNTSSHTLSAFIFMRSASLFSCANSSCWASSSTLLASCSASCANLCASARTCACSNDSICFLQKIDFRNAIHENFFHLRRRRQFISKPEPNPWMFSSQQSLHWKWAALRTLHTSIQRGSLLMNIGSRHFFFPFELLYLLISSCSRASGFFVHGEGRISSSSVLYSKT